MKHTLLILLLATLFSLLIHCPMESEENDLIYTTNSTLLSKTEEGASSSDWIDTSTLVSTIQSTTSSSEIDEIYLFDLFECNPNELNMFLVELDIDPFWDPSYALAEPNDPVEVTDLWMDDFNNLYVTIEYIGGCTDHDVCFMLYNNVQGSRVHVFTKHEDYDDPCEELIQETYSFNVTPIIKYWLQKSPYRLEHYIYVYVCDHEQCRKGIEIYREEE